MQHRGWKRSKTRELGVFAVGVGLILSALTAWLIFGMRSPGPQPPVSRTVLVLLPGALIAVTGILLLIVRSRLFVKITMVVLTAAFLFDAMLSINPIKLLISGGCIYLIWKTGRQALAEFPAAAET